MAIFEKAELITGAIEGGYVNDKTDRGGETYFGIARKFWPRWSGWVYIDSCKSKREFPNNINNERLAQDVHCFYKEKFWDRIHGDLISDQLIANLLYDIAVNMGVKRSSKFFQKTLNLLNRNQADYPDLTVDGAIGKKTISALNAYLNRRGQEGVFIMLFYLMVQQGGLWINLASKSPSQEKFMNGWGRRAILNIKHITDNYYGVTG